MSNFVSQKRLLFVTQHFPETPDIAAFVYFLLVGHSSWFLYRSNIVFLTGLK